MTKFTFDLDNKRMKIESPQLNGAIYARGYLLEGENSIEFECTDGILPMLVAAYEKDEHHPIFIKKTEDALQHALEDAVCDGRKEDLDFGNIIY